VPIESKATAIDEVNNFLTWNLHIEEENNNPYAAFPEDKDKINLYDFLVVKDPTQEKLDKDPK